MAVIANAVKQSVGLVKMSLKSFSQKLTDCFVALAMTAVYIFFPQPFENQLFELFYIFHYYQLIQPNTKFFRKFRNIS
jgi:hypothetical protein